MPCEVSVNGNLADCVVQAVQHTLCTVHGAATSGPSGAGAMLIV